MRFGTKVVLSQLFFLGVTCKKSKEKCGEALPQTMEKKTKLILIGSLFYI